MSVPRTRTSQLLDSLTRMVTARLDDAEAAASASEELWTLAWALGVAALTVTPLDVDSSVVANANAAVFRAKGLSHRLRASRGRA